MTAEPIPIDTDVLVIGSGAAGMYAAIEAARNGAHVLLADRSLIGRGGATVMAQMTVACALGEETPDDWEHHYADTIAAGRGLCDEKLAQLLCEDAPACIRELDQWGVGWARKDGHITATMAPGHDRPRCVYVDFINTGPAVSKTLRTAMARNPSIRKAGDLCIVDLVTSDGEVTGAVAYHLGTGAPVVIAAKATVLATGGLTRLYRRNSASANMGGDGYALALRAGATLIDMEFVQFFPIGHLAPRLVGMDPIMWDPFRYKLGGRLLNGRMEEFTSRYGSDEDGKYVLTRDLATYAIIKEVEAGRGSPHGGAYLSFEHCSAAALRAAFGPVIDRLAENHIDLTRMPVEVAPIAHYHMGGVKADASMATDVPGLYVAGEVVGGANGANRLVGQRHHRGLGVRPPRRAQRRRARETHGAANHQAARRCRDSRSHPRRRKGERHEKIPPRWSHICKPPWPITSVRSAPARSSARRSTKFQGSRRSSASIHPATPPPSICNASNGSTCATCSRSPTPSPRQRSRAPKAAARTSARIFRPCCRNGRCISGAASRRRAENFRRAGCRQGARLMSQETKQVATLKIWRGSARDAGQWQDYEVPFEPGQSVLDGLRWLRIHKDPSLAVRFSCINANACKECMIQLDGDTVYACTARLEPRAMTLTPLPNKKLIRDLVTEIAPPSERFGK